MNYASIGEAVRFYQDRGYVYFDDVPWRVGREAYYATKPLGAVDVEVAVPPQVHFSKETFLVASGEQSFIQMMIHGYFIKRAICVTPCFRWESRYDTLHSDHFMKAELINAQDVDPGHLVHMIHDACSFFEQSGLSVRVVPTPERGPDSYDIVEKGTRYELGSYGIRSVTIENPPGDRHGTQSFSWIYGTGCAEPRLEIAKQRALKNVGR